MTCLFSTRDIEYVVTPDGIMVIVTTDIPAHLWIRWTDAEPWMHRKPVLRRGIWIKDDLRFCFDVYTDTEQLEDGDTLIHTFLLPLWATDMDRWMYLWGGCDGEISRSTSPIFKTTSPATWPPPPGPARYAWSRTFNTFGNVRNRPVGTGLAATFTVLDTYTRSIEVYLFTKNNDATTVRVSLFRVDANDRPRDTALVSQDITLSDGVLIQDYDVSQRVVQHTIPLPYIYLQNRNYALVSITLTGTATVWQRFRRSNWSGPRDAGEVNHVTEWLTNDGGYTWSYAYPGRQTYECHGLQ